MVKPIVHDPLFLAQKSEPAAESDMPIALDLLETLMEHRLDCVGMAANMIGVRKRIIVFSDGGKYITMYNPEIIKKSGEYEAEEGCLSLSGTRKTKRYKFITVKYHDEFFKENKKPFFGWVAQIIQHEIDHCNGILI
ncbi:MAG: peptide deformylase [Oscillospiraceae bacterium]|nr:peptide deformylase [Oscillospiraceae bacterium]